MQIQEITVESPESPTPTVEITIAETKNPDDSSSFLIARVEVRRSGTTLENLQLDVLGRLRELIEQAAAPIEKAIREQR